MRRALLFVLLAFSLTGCAVRARYYGDDRYWDHDRYYHHYDRDERGHDHDNRWR